MPDIEDAGYIAALIDAIRTHKIDALLPTIDNDLVVLSENRERIAAEGCRPLISDRSVIDICRDKMETFRFLTRNGFDTPMTQTATEFLSSHDPTYPCFIKPRFGFAGLWAQKAEDRFDVDYYMRRIDEPIVQELVTGQEYTLDAYVGLSGSVKCVVPRARWQVRAGEVIKGVTVRDLDLMNATKRLIELLGPTVCGVVTTQCIFTADRRIRFLEMNPRFGGGAPLSIAAGADFPAWLMQELLGEQPRIDFDGFAHGMAMLRYDWSLFVQLPEDLRKHVGRPIRPWPEFM